MPMMMDMTTGKPLEDEESCIFAEEVVCSNWIAPQLHLQEVVPETPQRPARREPPQDADEFLYIVYLSQE
jgi:hypothetical protein